jgi:hypothetical protein
MFTLKFFINRIFILIFISLHILITILHICDAEFKIIFAKFFWRKACSYILHIVISFIARLQFCNFFSQILEWQLLSWWRWIIKVFFFLILFCNFNFFLLRWNYFLTWTRVSHIQTKQSHWYYSFLFWFFSRQHFHYWSIAFFIVLNNTIIILKYKWIR